MKILITGDISTWNITDFNVSKINTDILEKIKSSDKVIYNLEGPIGNSLIGEQSFSENLFKNNTLKIINSFLDKEQPQVFSDESILSLLKQNSDTIVTLANNHIKDLGLNGFLNTISLLDKNRIKYVGGEKKGEDRSSINVSENTFVLNYNFIGRKYIFNLYGSSKSSFGASNGDFKTIKKKVEELKNYGKKTILILHIGKEMVEDISKWDTELESIKDLDADITIIHHPHLYIQTEYEKDNIFILGDFIFNRPEKFNPDRKTAVLEIEEKDNKLVPQLHKVLVSEIYKY